MRKALIVGINQYQTSPLNGCINDAESVAKIYVNDTIKSSIIL